MKEDAGSVDHREFPAETAREWQIEKLVDRRNPRVVRRLSNPLGRLDAKNFKTQFSKMPQLGAIVGSDIKNRAARRSRRALVCKQPVYLLSHAPEVVAERSEE